jgi:hypothetical protein
MAISGYATATSVAPGAEIGFCLSSDSPGAVTCTVTRLGSVPVTASFTANVATQAQPAANAWEGFGWQVTSTFSVPAGWPSGLYQLSGNGQPAAEFVVLPAAPGSASRVLLQICFITPQAYSNSGGKSLYFFNSQPSYDESSRASIVSFDRDGALPGYEQALITWLEADGFAVEYCSDVDFDTAPGLLSNYDCLILAGHDEYWTKAKRDQIEDFIAASGNLVVLSGNTCFRQVRLQAANRQVVFYKYAGSDPEPDPAATTVAWADPPVSRPQNSFLGAGWTAGAFGGPATAYTIRFPGHWVFSGIPATTTPPATSAFMTYETDAAAFAEEDEGYPRVTGEEGTPLSFVVLASADLRSWASDRDSKPGFATMGIYRRNGTVFHGGAIEWAASLAGDPVLAQVTRNVIGRLRQPIPADWEDIGHANFGTALTALDGRLFIATSQNLLWRRFPVGAEVVWRQIGHANNVKAMTGSNGTLYCVTADNTLWWRPPVENDINWTAIGSGPAAGTNALAAAGGMLYAIDSAGTLCRTPAAKQPPNWQPVQWLTEQVPAINAMTAYSNILFASTTANRLLRTNTDWIDESASWQDIHHCNFSAGLAVIDGMLVVATTDNRLWQMDLHGLRQP